MRSTRTVLSGVALMTLVSAAAAKAAPTLQIHGGVYAAKETLVEQNKSAAVNAIVVDHGRRVRNVGVACNSGPAPGQGVMSDTTLTVHIPGSLTITHSGSFSYSGTVTLTSEDTQSGVSATSAVSIKGQFARGKVDKERTVALKGTISASVCAATTPPTFSLVWDTSSTAT
jgi:hypothetical protein